MKKAEFQVQPLTCPSCIKKIETILGNTKGVDSARVLFNSNKVKTEYDESIIDDESIKNIITKLGYPVLSSKVL